MDFSKKEFLCSFLKWSALQVILLLVVLYIIPWTAANFNLDNKTYLRAVMLLCRTNLYIDIILNLILVQLLMVIPCTLFFCVGNYCLKSKHKTIITYICYMILATILCAVGEKLVEDIIGFMDALFIVCAYYILTLLYPLIIGALQLVILKVKKVK